MENLHYLVDWLILVEGALKKRLDAAAEEYRKYIGVKLIVLSEAFVK